MWNDSQHRFAIVVGFATLAIPLCLHLFLGHGPDVVFINSHHHPALDTFARFVTNLGDGIVFLPFLLLAVANHFGHAAVLAISWAGHGIVSAILKRLIFPDVPRPISLIDNNLLYFVPGVGVHASFSFPSGHTATAFCLAMVLALQFRNRIVTLGLFSCAASVAFSRVYLLQHFTIDVAGGAFIGIAVGLLSWWLIFRNTRHWHCSGLWTLYQEKRKMKQ